MTDHAAEATRLQNLARQAGQDLADEWINQMRDMITMSQAVSSCEAVPHGLRDLTKRLISTLQVTTDAASAITSRAKAIQTVNQRKANDSGPAVPSKARIASIR